METAKEHLNKAKIVLGENADGTDFNIEDDATVFEDVVKAMKSYAKEYAKNEITKFQDFLLKNGYCDTDVYDEPPTAIDRYFNQ